MTERAQLDHLVVMATTLEEGARWCEARLGINPQLGGSHAFMSTHNRLLNIASPAHPRAYLEIIAIDPQAPALERRRWFDMDQPALRQAVEHSGPQLVNFVVCVPRIASAVAALLALGIDCGPVLAASRSTPTGLLQWQISVRDDGARLFDGCLPTLIEWGHTHPTSTMLQAGIELLDLQVTHPQWQLLAKAYQAIGLSSVTVQAGPAQISARLSTPRGEVQI